MADEEPDFSADFLAMSWQVPPALEMPPALFTPDEAPAAEVAAESLPEQFPPQPPPEVPRLLTTRRNSHTQSCL